MPDPGATLDPAENEVVAIHREPDGNRVRISLEIDGGEIRDAIRLVGKLSGEFGRTQLFDKLETDQGDAGWNGFKPLTLYQQRHMPAIQQIDPPASRAERHAAANAAALS